MQIILLIFKIWPSFFLNRIIELYKEENILWISVVNTKCSSCSFILKKIQTYRVLCEKMTEQSLTVSGYLKNGIISEPHEPTLRPSTWPLLSLIFVFLKPFSVFAFVFEPLYCFRTLSALVLEVMN